MAASRVTKFSEGPPGWAVDPSAQEGGPQVPQYASEAACCALSVSERKQQSPTNVTFLEAVQRPGCGKAE